MSLRDEISAAIGAHGLWKGKLREAIQMGKSEATPQGLRVDNQCTFGQWLHGASIPVAQKGSAGYKECLELHATFHVAAAHALELALAGRKSDAETAMRDGGEVATLTGRLIDAMMRWQKTAA